MLRAGNEKGRAAANSLAAAPRWRNGKGQSIMVAAAVVAMFDNFKAAE